MSNMVTFYVFFRKRERERETENIIAKSQNFDPFFILIGLPFFLCSL